MGDALKVHEGILTINNDYDVAVCGGGIAGILRLMHGFLEKISRQRKVQKRGFFCTKTI